MTATVVVMPLDPHPHPLDPDWKAQVSAENRTFHIVTRMGHAPPRSRPELVVDNEHPNR